MMGHWSLQQIAGELGLVSDLPDVALTGISTDTRRLKSGDLYVALRGEQFDGNQFIAQAAAAGAAAALVESIDNACELPQLAVTDSRFALGQLARCNRRRFTGPVVAVTGSAGKTTCKNLLQAIFSQAGSTLATRGNLNNEIGVPLTLLEMTSEHDYAVIEMGAAKVGDIDYLCQFAEPDVSLVTNAMAAHIEGFGSVANVAKGKGEIYASLKSDGVAVINMDDPYADQWRQQAAERKQISFSMQSSAADLYVSHYELGASGRSRFALCCGGVEVEIELALLGVHNIRNALAAAAVAYAGGLTLAQIKAGLEQVQPEPGRLAQRAGKLGCCVIDDSYNANPGAVRAAVDLLVEMPAPRWLVLGEMGELGEDAAQQHREVAEYARRKGVERLWAVGPWRDEYAQGFGEESVVAESRDALAERLIAELNGDETILVKGSRCAGMEQLVMALTAEQTPEEGI